MKTDDEVKNCRVIGSQAPTVSSKGFRTLNLLKLPGIPTHCSTSLVRYRPAFDENIIPLVVSCFRGRKFSFSGTGKEAAAFLAILLRARANCAGRFGRWQMNISLPSGLKTRLEWLGFLVDAPVVFHVAGVSQSLTENESLKIGTIANVLSDLDVR